MSSNKSTLWKQRIEAAKSAKSCFPAAFFSNDVKERFVLWRAENLRVQCATLLPDIEPLVLAVDNEVGVKKFVSTTISPNFLPFSELYEWSGCASFVADHVKYVPPENPLELPKLLHSPACVLQTRFATSFDLSTLLCSLLIGVGYDAYVASGFAHLRRVAECDLSWRKYPPPHLRRRLSTTGDEDAGRNPRAVDDEESQGKYARKLRPRKEFTSEYETVMTEREIVRSGSQTELVTGRVDPNSSAADDEENGAPKTAPDEERAVHAWVVVLPGKRDVDLPFFIEPSTGEGLALDATDYYNVVSVWNNENYWVNMRPSERHFDLNDPDSWEPFSVDPLMRTRLYKAAMQQQQRTGGGASKVTSSTALTSAGTAAAPGAGSTAASGGNSGAPGGVAAAAAALIQHHKQISAVETAIHSAMDAEEVPDWLPAFKMPPSWVGQLSLSAEKLERRFPDGKKYERFENAEVERFSPYLMQNGLVMREKFFSDSTEAQQETGKNRPPVSKTVETFDNRSDFLRERVEEFEEPRAGWMTEKFGRGRDDGVKEHHFVASSRTGGIVQKLVYWPGVRADGLRSRESVAGSRLVEVYDAPKSSPRPTGRLHRLPEVPDPSGETGGRSSSSEVIRRSPTKNPYEARNAWSLASIYRRLPKEKIVIFDRPTKKGAGTGAGSTSMVGNYPRVKEIIEIFSMVGYDTCAGQETLTWKEQQEVASIVFSVDKREIKVSYAPRRSRICFSTLTFHVPPLNEKGQVEVFTADMVQIHQADGRSKRPSRLELYRILEQLVKHQAKSEESTQKSLKENETFISCREAELSSLTLLVSIFHPDRNADLRKQRNEEERQEAERRTKASEDTVDPLLPYLCRRKPTDVSWDDFHQCSSRPVVDLKDSNEICEEYLSEIRARLLDKANHMQSKLEQTESKLRMMQLEYQSKVGQLSAQREKQLTQEITTLSFSLKVLEKRLKFLRREAAEKYKREEKALKSDSRVQSLMIP